MNNKFFKEITAIREKINVLNDELQTNSIDPKEKSAVAVKDVPKKKKLLRGNQYALDQFLYQQNYINYKQNLKKYKTSDEKELAESKINELSGGMDELEKKMNAQQFKRSWNNLGKKQKLFKIKEFINESPVAITNKPTLLTELIALLDSKQLKTAAEVKYSRNNEKIKSIKRLTILSDGTYTLDK